MIDPATAAGNVEHFMGVAQVPIGVAGPLRINGEHVMNDGDIVSVGSTHLRFEAT